MSRTLHKDPPRFALTHCSKMGHSHDVYGRYSDGTCRECKRVYNSQKAKLPGGRRQYRRIRSAVTMDNGPDLTMQIISLDIKIDREPMAWRRSLLKLELKQLRNKK